MSAGGRQDGRSNLSRAAAVKASYKMTPTIKDAESLPCFAASSQNEWTIFNLGI